MRDLEAVENPALPFTGQNAVLDSAERSQREKSFGAGRRSVELRALCNDSPRTPPGPEGSNGSGTASCAAEYPKFLPALQASEPRMGYKVIARKYRPRTFSEIVGQEHVTRTLANAIN